MATPPFAFRVAGAFRKRSEHTSEVSRLQAGANRPASPSLSLSLPLTNRSYLFTLCSVMYAPDPTFDDDYDEPDSPDGWERALLDRQLEELRELAAMGMDLARDIHRRAKAASDEAPLAERQQAALNFARVTRAVRLTHALETRLVADFKARSAGAGGADADEGPIEYRWIGQLSPAEKARRTRLQDVVRGVAEGERRDPETVERLVREAGERVEDDGIFGNLMTRPFGEISP